MTLAPGARRFGRRAALLLALATVAGLAVAPEVLSLSSGAHKGTIQDPAFGAQGCAACHGPAKEFLPLEDTNVEVRFIDDATGEPLNGPYDGHTTYTVNITLQEQNAPDGGETGNHAGFNLRAAAGTLEAVEGVSQVTEDGTQATHVDASRTAWQVVWTPPESGAAAFRLFVNDVDGDGANNEADEVYQIGFWFPDEEGAEVGAAAEEEEEEFGVPLQQYWIGLIGLAGMIAIMVGGYVYLKYVNPHHTGPKDR